MDKIHYKIVTHDGGWAYTLAGAFSEAFPSAAAARHAAQVAAAEQQVGGETTMIEYQDADGAWHTERSEGGDRPEADVE